MCHEFKTWSNVADRRKRAVQKPESRYLTIAGTTDFCDARKLDFLWITTGFEGVPNQLNIRFDSTSEDVVNCLGCGRFAVAASNFCNNKSITAPKATKKDQIQTEGKRVMCTIRMGLGPTLSSLARSDTLD
jgi:hypothetical protein